MPVLPNVPKVVRVDLFFSVGSSTRVRDRFYFQYTGAGPTVADLATLTTTLASAWTTNLAQDQSTSTSMTQVLMTDLTSPTAAQRIGTVSVTGTLATGPVASLCPVIRFRIARRYRGGHPRFYFPGTGTGSLGTAQLWGSTFVTNLGAHWSGFLTAFFTTPPVNVGTMTHVNVSFFSGFTVVAPAGRRAKNVPVLRGTPLIDPVISYSVNPIIASQRRRLGQSP